MLAKVIIATTFVAGLVSAAKEEKTYDCSRQLMPDHLQNELQLWYGNTDKLEMYIYPDYAESAVLRLKNFKQARCGKENVKIYESQQDIKPTTVDWITINSFDFDEIVFTAKPSKAQWGQLFARQDNKTYHFGVEFRGRTHFAPITFKRPTAHIETSSIGVEKDGDDEWRKVTVHCSEDYCADIAFLQHGVDGIDAQSEPQTIGVAEKELFGGAMKAKCAAKDCSIRTRFSEESVKKGTHFDYFWTVPKSDTPQIQPTHYFIAPVQWTQTEEDYFKDPKGDYKGYNHWKQGRMQLMPNYFHTFKMHIPGLPLKALNHTVALEPYWRKGKVQKDKFTLFNADGDEVKDEQIIKKAIEQFASNPDSQSETDLKLKKKMFGDFECEDKKPLCGGKVSKKAINFHPKNDKMTVDGVEYTYSVKTSHGAIALKAHLNDKDDKKRIVSYLPYNFATDINLVYVTKKALGGDKLSASQLLPIRFQDNNYVFGTNQEFKKDIDRMNTISFPMVEGMPFSFQIQCVGKCPTYRQWIFNVHDNAENKDFAMKDREASAQSKWAAISDSYGFYVLETLDYAQEKNNPDKLSSELDVKRIKERVNIKTVQINANPWGKHDSVSFQLYYRDVAVPDLKKPYNKEMQKLYAEGKLNESVAVSLDKQTGDKLVMQFNVIVEEWDGVKKFWIGLVTLTVIIVGQILSCVYMAKRNAAKNNN